MKKRIDELIMERELLESLRETQSLIMQGKVYVNGEKIDKSGHKVDNNCNIDIRIENKKFVSRGGYKLEKALDEFNVEVNGKIGMDIGASTGGFTDCLLKKGLSKIYAVDVGYGQLDWELRNDDRVIVMERTNIRDVRLSDIGEKLDIITVDVSFISLNLVLPIIKKLLKKDGKAIILIKPQFEARREDVGEKGVIREKKVHEYVIRNIFDEVRELDFSIEDITYSPITGAEGNIEFLALLGINYNYEDDLIDINRVINEAHEELL